MKKGNKNITQYNSLVYDRNTTTGITLVALVVTIVVLLILAGITIQLIMSDGGIIARAQQTKEKQRIAEILEQLNIAEADNSIKQMMKVTIDSCIEEIHTKGIVVPEYTEKQDDSHYQITTEDGYVFTVTQEGIDIVFEYLGQKGNLPPVIRTKAVTTNSIEIEVVANGKTIKNCTYYIKEQGAENYDAGTKKNETTHIYTGLTNNTIYSVKVAVEIEGESELVEITKLITVGKIPEGAITADVTWGSGTANTVLKTTETGYSIQYQINNREGTWKEYTATITGLHHGDVVYARLYDGTSGSNSATVNIIDDVEPQSATISLSSTNTTKGTAITATVTQIDNESGIKIENCKWVYNTTASTIGTNESDYTGGVFSSNPETISLNTNAEGTYYLHVLSIDVAGNKKETISNAITVKETIVGGEFNESKGVNSPKIDLSQMTPIKWDGSKWITTTTNDNEWYDYTTSSKKWANAKTEDGSMWVWIPRYAYQIETNWHTNSVTGGTINIKFLKGTTDEASDGTTSWNNASGQGNWNVHPAFSYGSNVAGIWVAKFEASANGSAIQVKPGVASWRSITINDIYSKCLGYNSTLNSHQMKNSEWGACAYLAQSTYGKNSEVWINNSSSWITGCAGNSVSAEAGIGTTSDYTSSQGGNASTTGNMYGIYDMNGGAWEYVAAYVNNGHPNLIEYGNNLVTSTNMKTKDVYTSSASFVEENTQETDYETAKGKYGDAIYETSANCYNIYGGSWYGDYTIFPRVRTPFFLRGGEYGNTSIAGLFCFNDIMGSGNNNLGFRPALCVM